MTKYPNDEFDRVPEFTNRKGVHRQAIVGTAARRSPLGWIVAFGVLALVVGLFSYFVLPQLTGQPVSTAAASSSSSAPSASTSGDAGSSSATQGASGAATDGAGASESAAAAKSKAAAESAAAESAAKESDAAAASSSAAAASSSAANAGPDLSSKIGVYNGSRRSGLAASGQSTLSGAGFTNVSAANWTKKVNTSIVYYKSDADQATAEKAASALGIGTVYQTSNIPGSIAVVLGSDF